MYVDRKKLMNLLDSEMMNKDLGYRSAMKWVAYHLMKGSLDPEPQQLKEDKPHANTQSE